MATLLAAADWLPDNRYADPDKVEFALSLGLGLSAIVLTLRDRMNAASLARWRNRALLSLATIAISIAVAEPMTRFAFRDVTTSSDNGGYFTQRWFHTGAVRLNSSGFREREFTPQKPAGTYRIAAVGDSFTFGNGVRQQDRYSDLLQARLPSHFEVLNFGAPGANTPEHRSLVAHLLTDVHPDFVLLQWYVNDAEDDDSSGRPTFRPLMPIRSVHDWLNDVSALYTVADMQWAKMQVTLGMTTSYPDYLLHRLGDPNSHDSRVDRDLLLDLVERCRRAGVPLGIVLFPDTAVSPDQEYPYGYLHDRVLEICQAQNLTCLDLRHEFSLIKDNRLLWANRLDHHPSALANELAAVKILETYSSIWAASR
jgi:hypothetical protein